MLLNLFETIFKILFFTYLLCKYTKFIFKKQLGDLGQNKKIAPKM